MLADIFPATGDPPHHPSITVLQLHPNPSRHRTTNPPGERKKGEMEDQWKQFFTTTGVSVKINAHKIFILTSLLAVFVDPLFFFVTIVSENFMCILVDVMWANILVFFRIVIDAIYFLNICLQFRLAYVAPRSRVVGTGELVRKPSKIAINYLFGKFIVNLIIALPLPEIITMGGIPMTDEGFRMNYAKKFLHWAICLQYIPRVYRILPWLAGRSTNGYFIFESLRMNFILNSLTFMLVAHVIGSSWYLFAFKDKPWLHQESRKWRDWTRNKKAAACFYIDDQFSYGIFRSAVHLISTEKMFSRYSYSLVWGIQQLSTLGGNLNPSYYDWEVCFTFVISVLGLFFFAFLIGNMQMFIQSIGRRRFDMLLRSREIEWYMQYRNLPDDLRRQVRRAELFRWTATQGIDEEQIIQNLPENVQRSIRRFLFEFIKKVRIFSMLDEPVLDALCEHLRLRGKMEVLRMDGSVESILEEGNVCGEELLAWCMDGSLHGRLLTATAHVRCLTDVEAFHLPVADLDRSTKRFATYLRRPRIQGAIRYESPYWRGLAASRIQQAWRMRKMRQE